MARQPLTSAQPIRWWILAPTVALALFLVPMPAWAVDEFYSRNLYPWIQTSMTALSNLVSFAVIDLLIVVVVGATVLRAIRLVGAVRSRGPVAALVQLVKRSIRFVSVAALIFFVAWGCNYRRLPIETTLPGGHTVPVTADRVEALVMDANRLAATLRAGVLADGDLTVDRAASLLTGPMDRALTALNAAPLSRPGRPKASLWLTPFWTLSGVSGMVNPFLLESIVYPDLLPFERPAVLAHEWAHLAGHADEAEASAVGWLACMKGPPQTAYSAMLFAITEGIGALRGDARRRAIAAIDPGVRLDLAAISERLRRQQPQVQAATTRVYDTYLRANRVADGTASYGRALTLILAPPFREAIGEYRY